MISRKQVDTALIYSVASEISAKSNEVSNVSMRLNEYMQTVGSDWDTKKKQTFMQALNETQSQISSCANLLEELASQVRMIPSKVIVQEK